MCLAFDQLRDVIESQEELIQQLRNVVRSQKSWGMPDWTPKWWGRGQTLSRCQGRAESTLPIASSRGGGAQMCSV